MSNLIIKLLIPTVLLVGIFITTYSIFSIRSGTENQHPTTQLQPRQEQLSDIQQNSEEHQTLVQTESDHLEQEKIIKKRLLEEFEDAFLKQYTPPVGCENWANESHMVRCTNHQIKAKQAYQEEFIKKRGLPKDTFDHPQLSFTN